MENMSLINNSIQTMFKTSSINLDISHFKDRTNFRYRIWKLVFNINKTPWLLLHNPGIFKCEKIKIYIL